MMRWLPAPADFLGDLRAALTVTDPTVRLERLSALAQHRLGYLETIQLDHALRQVSAEAVPELPTVRLAILSSSTVDHLAPAIRVAGLRRRLPIEVYVGPYGQYRQLLLDAASPLHEVDAQVVLLSLSARDVISTASVAASAQDVDRIIGQSIDELRTLWRQAREVFNASVIQQTFLNFADPLFGSYDRLVPGAPAQIVAGLNTRLAEAAASDGVLLLDIARASERDGLDAWFDVARWLQAQDGDRAAGCADVRRAGRAADSSPPARPVARSAWCSISTTRSGAA